MYSLINNKSICVVGVDDSCSKLVSDFLFVFNEANCSTHFGFDIFDDESYKEMQVIICSWDITKTEEQMKTKGLKHFRDYYFADDFFESLNIYKKKKPYLVKKTRRRIKDNIIDLANIWCIRHKIYNPNNYLVKLGIQGIKTWGHKSDQQDNEVSELERHLNKGNKIPKARFVTYAFLEFISESFTFFSREKVEIISDNEEMAEMLYNNILAPNLGGALTISVLEWHSLLPIMMKVTYYDKRQNVCGCTLPLNLLYVGNLFSLRLCECPEFLDIPIGFMGSSLSVEDHWKNKIARVIRLSIINNTYSFCNRNLCRKLRRNTDEYSAGIIKRKECAESGHSEKTMLAFDNACNYKCPSCRKSYYTKNPDHIEYFNDMCVEKIIDEKWLETNRLIIVGSAGECFLSNSYKKVLFEGEGRRNEIVIATNGSLFTPQIWEKIENKYKTVSITVSVDATTSETYKKLRTGDYEILMRNMDFLSELRKNGKVKHVTVNLIVQKDNYKEMKDFVIWAKEKGFDRAYLSNIWNWGTYSSEEFAEISMFDEHQKMKPELAKVLEDPIFEDPIVDKRWE